MMQKNLEKKKNNLQISLIIFVCLSVSAAQGV